MPVLHRPDRMGIFLCDTQEFFIGMPDIVTWVVTGKLGSGQFFGADQTAGG